nr:Cation efflux protein domain containing protein [Haemonchus contortus]
MLAHDFLKKDDRTFKPTSSSRSAWYFCVLVLTKILRCIGIFFLDILVKGVHVVSLLWLVKICASALLLPIQKPLSHGHTLRKPTFVRIAKLAIVNCLIEVLWFYGITFCGPLRSVLVFELSPSVLLVAIASIFKGNSSTAKSRGLFFLVIGYLSLLLLDRDHSVEDPHDVTHGHHSGLNHLFYHLIATFGVSDHQGGVAILFLALVLRIGYDNSFRHLAVEIGGPKRLYSLVSTCSALMLTPFGILLLIMKTSVIASLTHFIILLFIATVFVMVLDFYAESVCFQHVADPVMAAARWSPVTMFSCALGLAWVWYAGQGLEDHHVTSGVIITVVAFVLASVSLTSAGGPKHRGGELIGMSDSGMPLFAYKEAFLQKTGRSLILFFKDTLREILANSDSRRIFWFLCVNLSFCGVEFLYGFWTNSLGLISDGFHMLFDCSALVMGLVAAVMSRWPATRHFSYGYGRVEVLSGFINALFLCVIALFILLEALERLFDPPNINTDRLLFVAISGLLVNLFGMYSFHGGEGDHGHGHSHGGGSHGHSHSGNANMEGVFLHVLADTLGSVFVIISTLLIQWFGWTWVDPLCSLILSILILGSVYPLLTSSINTLLQDIPDDEEFEHHLCEALEIDGVKSYSKAHYWQLKSDLNVASVHIQATPEANAQLIRHKVSAQLRAAGATQCSVQVEKDFFTQRIQQLCPSYRFGHNVVRGTTIARERKSHSNHGHGHSHNGHGHGHSH